MKNLKKALSLLVVVATLCSFMTFGASATNFSDASSVKNTEAVNTMNSLNIINGFDDGTFQPTGLVTRAQMAKMICVALNGGTDPLLGNSVSSFKDTQGHWAAGYIEYCYNLGIIGGYGNGNFGPDDSVTGTQAAKMLLVAIGYDAAAEGFSGDNWSIAVNVRATQKGF